MYRANPKPNSCQECILGYAIKNINSVFLIKLLIRPLNIVVLVPACKENPTPPPKKKILGSSKIIIILI